METTRFALRTTDQAWTARHNGQPDGNGRVTVEVPAGEVERVALAGRPALRHRFADVPADLPNASCICLAEWVEASEVTALRPVALEGRALFLAKARAEGLVRQ